MSAEILATLIAAIVGVVGGLAGVGIGVVLQQRSNRVRAALDLHAEFNNAEFSHARPRAAILLKENPAATFGNITAVSPIDAPYAWLVVRFYQRLWISIKYRYVAPALIPELFGNIFFWWFYLHFETKLLPLDYETSRHIADLKKWFDDHVDELTRLEWKEQAFRDSESDLALAANAETAVGQWPG